MLLHRLFSFAVPVLISSFFFIAWDVHAQSVAPQSKSKKADEFPDSWAAFKASRNPEDKRLVVAIEKMKWWDVCRDWGYESRKKGESRRHAALREFLLVDNRINGTDLMNVQEKRVAVGMTSCGVVASLGMPDTTNYTTTASRTRAQMVYRTKRFYVYTEASANDGNGIVTSIQH